MTLSGMFSLKKMDQMLKEIKQSTHTLAYMIKSLYDLIVQISTALPILLFRNYTKLQTAL
jgi:hypothetical protein